MDTPSLLKGEINQTLDDLHDFAKWKLIVVSALAAAALGLPGSTSAATDWLLVFVPFACAYIDLNCYQYLLRIFLLAKCLRESSNDELLRNYESQCESYRRQGYFGLGLFAQLGCSLAFSIALPFFAVSRLVTTSLDDWKVVTMLVGWAVGLLVLILIYVDFKSKTHLLDKSGANSC